VSKYEKKKVKRGREKRCRQRSASLWRDVIGQSMVVSVVEEMTYHCHYDCHLHYHCYCYHYYYHHIVAIIYRKFHQLFTPSNTTQLTSVDPISLRLVHGSSGLSPLTAHEWIAADVEGRRNGGSVALDALRGGEKGG
jgi:hypothetical protein